ncbi:hypothetical protein [Streptomyces sp. NRRL F-2664]|uniref:hypothetical protein n=1 Tax=Streptomyces sp. NRRL F-2664 TaxID=1463842 RepID=UPI0004C8E797|nr:hypothetical protein [Streptomyces sp. NRRL F-2664]
MTASPGITLQECTDAGGQIKPIPYGGDTCTVREWPARGTAVPTRDFERGWKPSAWSYLQVG